VEVELGVRSAGMQVCKGAGARVQGYRGTGARVAWLRLRLTAQI
jgi:hypothetical protein